VPTWQDWNAGIAALGRKKHWRAALATAEEMHHRRPPGDIQNGKWNQGILHVWMHLLLEACTIKTYEKRHSLCSNMFSSIISDQDVRCHRSDYLQMRTSDDLTSL